MPSPSSAEGMNKIPYLSKGRSLEMIEKKPNRLARILVRNYNNLGGIPSIITPEAGSWRAHVFLTGVLVSVVSIIHLTRHTYARDVLFIADSHVRDML